MEGYRNSFAHVRRQLVVRRRATRMATLTRRLVLKTSANGDGHTTVGPASADGDEYQLQRDSSLSPSADRT